MCGCNKAKSASALSSQMASRNSNPLRSTNEAIMQNINEVSKDNDFVRVIYNGPTYSHYIPLLTTNAKKKYGIMNYGVGKRGDRIFISKEDFEKGKEKDFGNGPLFLEIAEKVEEKTIKVSSTLTETNNVDFVLETKIDIIPQDVSKETAVEAKSEIEEDEVIESEVVPESPTPKSKGRPKKTSSEEINSE